MGLRIEQTHALLGMERTPGGLDIHTQQPEVDLSFKQAKVNIKVELPKIEIDQYEAFASAGLKNNGDLIKDMKDFAYQKVMEYIAKVVGDGKMLASIENEGNPIAEIAKRNTSRQHEFGMVTMPSVGPKISVKEGVLEIDPERTAEGIHFGVEAEVTPGEVDIQYTPDQIKLFLLQYPSIRFSYETGENIDEQV